VANVSGIQNAESLTAFKRQIKTPLFREHLHSKKCWVVLTHIWVKYGQTQPLGYYITLLTTHLSLYLNQNSFFYLFIFLFCLFEKGQCTLINIQNKC